MHTSTLLVSQNFEYWQSGENGLTCVDFETFCPDYHELDRTGVISPCLCGQNAPYPPESCLLLQHLRTQYRNPYRTKRAGPPSDEPQ